MPKVDIDKLVSFQTKKSIHVNLTKEAHAGLKIACFRRGLSIQEVFDEVAQMIAADHPDILSIIDDLALKKRNKVIRQLSHVDADSILSIIELNNPFSGDKS
jgi:hypothetical protein